MFPTDIIFQGGSQIPGGLLSMLRVDYNFIDVEYRYGLSQVNISIFMC